MAKSNLYSYENKFELITNGGATITEIEEPVDWAGQETVLTRDPKWHGVNFEFTEAEFPLGFDCASGRSILKNLYDTFGNDATGFLRFSSKISGVWQAMPDLKLDFNFYEDDLSIIRLTLKRTSFEDLFRTRFGIKHNINSVIDLDGNPMGPLIPNDLELHSKELFLQTDREFSDSNPIVGFPPLQCSDLQELLFEDAPILSSLAGGNQIQHREQTFYAQPSFGKINFDDIKTNQNVPFGVSLTGPNPQYVLDEPGLLSVDLSLVWNASLYVSPQWRGGTVPPKIEGCQRSQARIGFVRIELVLQIHNTEYIIESFEDNNGNCFLQIFSVDNSKFWTGSGVPPTTANILKNDSIVTEQYVTSLFDGSENQTNGSTISDGSLFKHSIFNTQQVVNKGDEVAIYVRYFVEGNYDRHGNKRTDIGWMVQSAFYNEDLELTPNTSFLKMSLNSVEETTHSASYLIHETVNKSLEITTGLAGRLRSSILGRTSLGYVQNGCAAFNALLNGFSIRNFNVADRPPNTSLEEELNSLRAIYNIGYGLGTDSGDDVLIVEKAEHFYQDVEIRTVEDPSDYRIEVDSEHIYNEIEIGFETFQEDGLNLLDEPNTRRRFITPIRTEKRKIDIISSYISSGYTIELQRRDQFNTSVSESLDYDDKIFIIAVRLDQVHWVSEKDEDFISVSGVFSPETSYNLKLTPKRMLYRWSMFLKSSLKYKNQATEKIRFIFGFKNNDLETETNSACEQPGLIKESDDILLNNFPDSSNGLFSPEKIEFKERLSWPDFEQIRKALKGESVLSDNFGYIRVKNPEGIYENGWPMEIRYNISSQQASYILRKQWQ